MERKELAAAVCSDTGRKRKANEDSTLLIPEAGVFCLADGMGGVEGGAVASQQTLKIVGQALGAEPRTLSFAEKSKRIKEGLVQANRWIRNWAAARGNKGCGTTFVALLLDFTGRGRTSFFNAGDSRGYCYHQGVLRQITRDHSVASAFGAQHAQAIPAIFKNVIVNAIGAQVAFSLDQTRVAVEPGDLFLLCSDGLTTMLPDAEIARLLAEHVPTGLDAAARALVQAANEAGGFDNISVILVHILAPLTQDKDEDDRPATATHNELAFAEESPRSKAEPQEPPSTEDSEVMAYSCSEETPTADHLPGHGGKPRKKVLLIAIGLGLAVLGALASLALLGAGKKGKTPPPPSMTHPGAEAMPVPVPQTPPPPDAAGATHMPAPAVAAPAALSILTEEEVAALVRDHLESGKLDELHKRLRQDAALQEQLRLNRKEYEAFNSWLSEWRRNNANPERVPVEYQLRQMVFAKLAPWLDARLGEDADVAWPADAAERANLYCQLAHRQQQEVLDAAQAWLNAWDQQMQVLGPEPDHMLQLLESLAAQPGLRRHTAAIESAMADLRRWMARSRPRPISAEDWDRVMLPLVTDLHANMLRVQTGIWASVAAISPESLRRIAPAAPINAALEIKRRNLAAINSQDVATIWKNEESRARLQAILGYLAAMTNTGAQADSTLQEAAP